MKGSLSEFRLAEILQLIAVQTKSGVLRLWRGNEVVTFYFDQGVLVSSRDRRHVDPDPLLDFLSKYGFLQPDMVKRLSAKLHDERANVSELVLDERYMTEPELQEALEDLAQELVFRTFTWRSGSYQFVAGDELLEGFRHEISLKVEALLMEGARQVDEWPRLREKLPGPEVLLGAVHDPPTSVGPRAHRLLLELREPTLLGDLVRRGRTPEFEVYEILAQAEEAGILQVLDRPSAVSKSAPTASNTERRRHTRAFGWSAALLACLVSCALYIVAPRFSRETPVEIQVLEAEQARERLRRSLEIYRALHGRYPNALADLTTDQLASLELLRRTGPIPYHSSRDGRSFTLGRVTRPDSWATTPTDL